MFYQPVPDTSFSLGIFIPDTYGTLKIRHKKEFVDKQYSPEYNEENCKSVKTSKASNLRHEAICSMIKNDTTNGNFLAQNWNYCKMSSSKTRFLTENDTFTNEDLLKNKFRSSNPNDYICDNELINTVLFDFQETSVYEEQWKDFENEQVFYKGVEMGFILTSSGVFRKYWSKQATDEYDDEDCVQYKENLLKIKNNQYPDYYRRLASMGGDKTRIYSIIRKGSCKEDSILSAKLSLVDGYIAAVTGYLRNLSSFRNDIKTMIDIKQNRSFFKYCSKDVDCFAVDENGFIIYSNRENDPNNIADVHYEVVKALEENKFFIRTEIINENDICKKVNETAISSSASRLINDKNNQKLFTLVLTASSVLFYSKKGTWNSLNLVIAAAWIICANAVTTYLLDETEPCAKSYDVFTANKSVNFSCGKVKSSVSNDEYKYFYSTSISGTNLNFIFVSIKNFFEDNNDCREIKFNQNYTLENPRKTNITKPDDICDLYGSCGETKRERENSDCFSLSFKGKEDNYYCDDNFNTRNHAADFNTCLMQYYLQILFFFFYFVV